MGVLISMLTGLGLTEKLARIVAPIAVVVLVVVLFLLVLNAYGDARYDAGKAAADLAWHEAAERLEEQSTAAGEYADVAAADRAADYAKRVLEEKEKVDATIDEGGNPLDVLF